MQLTIKALAASATLFAFSTPAAAQSLHFDGLLNSPLGTSSLSTDAMGHLVVSNIGSSGLDGVSIDLGESDGSRIWPLTQLAGDEKCIMTTNVMVQGSSVTLPVSITFETDATGTETFVFPDFTSIGSQTYTLRVHAAGQVVAELPGQSGGTKMHNNPNANSLPLQVYMMTSIAGVGMLECVDWDGGVTPPGGGNPIACDFLEFLPDNGNQNVIGANSVDIQLDGPSIFLLETEEMRTLDHFVQGTMDAHLDSSNGRLKVSNLGSSGCDGVSIDLGEGDNFGEVQLLEIAAPGEPNSTIWLESVDSAGQLDSIRIEELGGLWEFTPDFSQLGAGTFELELQLQGQTVFQQSGMTGAALKCARFGGYYKKKTQKLNGTTEVEWCIGGLGAVAHTVAGGPTILADVFMLRAEDSQTVDTEILSMSLRAAHTTSDITVMSIFTTGDPCLGNNYCIGAINSTGQGAVMCSNGSTSVADNALVLTCSNLPVGQPGIFFYGPNQISVPFGNGFRCVGGATNRLSPHFANASGMMSHNLDNTAPPTASGQIQPGDIWNFQCWYRDPAAGGAGYNLSDGHWILFTP